MFSRRKSRSGHSTAYTGVNHAAPLSAQPNSNALAAALTIGNAMKDSPSRTGSVVRSPAFANTKSRTSSIQRSPSVRNAFSNFNSASSHERPGFTVASHPGEAHKDYNNHEKVGDLKLSAPANGKQKMVKKYIPTPNGIKIIEVPAANMEKELARHNSLRSNSNMSRAGSMTSLRASQRRPGSRMSSLIRSPQLNRVPEERVAVTSPITRSFEYEQLQKQIEEEERLQRDIELKRLEYEKLKQRRLEEEEELRRLQAEAQRPKAAPAAYDSGSSGIPKPVLGDLQIAELEDNFLANTIAEATSATSDFTDDHIQKEIDSELEKLYPDPANIIVDELEEKEVEEIANEASIDPSKLVVDELESKKANEFNAHVVTINTEGQFEGDNDVSHINLDELDEKTLENFNPNFTNVDDSFQSVDHDHTFASVEDDFGIEEILDDEPTPNLAKQLRPTFDAVPDVIDPTQDHGLTDSLEIPAPIMRDAGSVSSVTSSAYDSPSPSKDKKPMKSAMKNSTSSYTLAEKQKGNAAHEAYLSLTTAENTRLNSKLSAPQLNDVAFGQSHHYPAASPLNNKLSQTLRKPPPVTSNGFQKTMRPQSMQVEGSKTQDPKSLGTRMSNRSLRDRSSVYVAPLSPHPALQPGYQSPSKARASELYAKAKSRPHSTFKPRERSSSYSKGLDEPYNAQENGQAEKPKPVTAYRTTLRDLTRDVSNNHAQEDHHTGDWSKGPQNIALPAAIDSHRNMSSGSKQNQPPTNNNVSHIPKQFTPSQPQEILTLRNNEPKTTSGEILTLRPEKKGQTAPGKEKKKLGRLRKLFGRN